MTPRGWCPSLFEPMPTGDGLLVRVKPPGRRLTADAARLIARAAATHGNGVIELTGRASLQIRGLSPESTAPFARAMVAAGLASGDPAAERRRTVIATPLADADPAVAVGTSETTAALEAALERDRSLDGLPAKFGFLVDGGGMLPLVGVSADICIRVLDGHCEIGIDGGDPVVRVRLSEAAETALRLSRAFLALTSGRERRMRPLVQTCGAELVFGAAGLRQSLGSPRLPKAEPIGYAGQVEQGAFGAGLPFGSVTAPVLEALADLGERFGDGLLRLTPWRAVLLAGVERARADALRTGLTSLGLIADPQDRRLRISACPGQPACASATVATRSLAALLTPEPGVSVHVSGCSKGCAHPGPAAVTLVGREGRFDLVRRGRAADAPVRRGLSAAEALVL